MARCTQCSAEVPDDHLFCGNCGSPLDVKQAATQTSLSGAAGARPSDETHAPGIVASGKSRFLPGAIIADRYRVIGMLGRGGMGEVYRADDLKLGQPVALKFLPPALSDDPDRKARFLNEVRVSLSVTHPNVCRVYDIGEVEGQSFLSMEYIDGENLASLLRRIGRLPGDKAVEISRQLCAGLAAAHDQGIVHRDLKPANVMLDGRGRARITDFGLSGLESGFLGGEVRAGTPAYMSPEQLAGKEVTFRSDIYSLGLVMYELFTGKAAFEGESHLDLVHAHQNNAPTEPSTLITDLDPVAERIILRCLEKDPSRRPETPMEISAALPGGDPLAAALAAGETPSPEMLAAAGESEAMAPPVAALIAVLSVALIAVAGYFAAQDDLQAYVPMGKSPEVLEDRARELVREFGFTEEVYADPGDSAVGFSTWTHFLDYIDENDESPDRWERLAGARPAAVDFWYRQTPNFYIPLPRWGSVSLPSVGRWNPFPSVSGEIMVSLSMDGSLSSFTHMPNRFDSRPEGERSEPFDWAPMFQAADLEMADFQPTRPRYQRYMDPEETRAWVGHLPDVPEFELRVEAGAMAGRPTMFMLLWPWETEQLDDPPTRSPALRADLFGSLAFFLSLIAVAIWISRRHMLRGRADRVGAYRLAVAVFFFTALWELLRTHSGLYTNPILLIFVLSASLLSAGIIGAFYLSVEPYVRKIWPNILISWTRLAGGDRVRWHDPTVGRSVLMGLALGAIFSMTWVVRDRVTAILEGGVPRPPVGLWEPLLGQRYVLAKFADAIQSGAMDACITVLLLVIARFVFRKPTLAVVLIVLIPNLITFITSLGGGEVPLAWFDLALNLFRSGLAVFVLLRFGLVALAVAEIVFPRLTAVIAVHDWGEWYARPAITTLVFLGAIAAYGYWAATSGRPTVAHREQA